MPNGGPLFSEVLGDNQPVLAVQKPGDDSIYFLFTAGSLTTSPSSTWPFAYSIINMRLDGGLGDIEPGFKNIPLPFGTKGYNAVTGIRHKNNHDTWVVVRLCSIDSNYFAAYLITNAGLNAQPVLSSSKTSMSPTPFIQKAHQLRISPDGTKLACLYHGDTIEIASFNPENGTIQSLFTFKAVYNGDTLGLQSVEFSIDSKILYLSSYPVTNPGHPKTIFQFDATLTDSVQFIASQTAIGFMYEKSGLQMGPDWKIYGTESWNDSLLVINSPSITGPGCGFQKNAVSLEGHLSYNGLPQFIQRYKAYIHESGHCQNNPVVFTPDIWPPPDSVYWDFGDPSSGGNNHSYIANATHSYSQTGTYSVTLFVRHIDKRTDMSHVSLTIFARPDVSPGPDKTVCLGDSATFDAGFCSGCTYEWKNNASGMVVGNMQLFKTSQAGIYTIEVTNAGDCKSSDTVQLFTTSNPTLTTAPLYDTICSGQSTSIALTSNPSGAIFHWTASLTSGNITGFTADSGTVINQTLTNTLSTPGIVTYHITPKIGSCTGTTVNFPVTVVPGDSVKVTITTPKDSVCTGTSITFTAHPTNPGANPHYQWQVNGVNKGTD